MSEVIEIIKASGAAITSIIGVSGFVVLFFLFKSFFKRVDGLDESTGKKFEEFKRDLDRQESSISDIITEQMDSMKEIFQIQSMGCRDKFDELFNRTERYVKNEDNINRLIKRHLNGNNSKQQ